MLYLRLEAPFAAFRPMTAGWYRPTARTMTPSAAYGLLLNAAAIESRRIETDDDHDGKTPASLTRLDLPQCRIALGRPDGTPPPHVQSVLQQLHNYPVGKDAGVPTEWTKGNKNNVSPVRREFLSDLSVVIALDGSDDFEGRVRKGLQGELGTLRYGLPFVGDNAFLIDRLDLLDVAPSAHWLERLEPEGETENVSETMRLTLQIDRAGWSGTRSALFAYLRPPERDPPSAAWIAIGDIP